MKILKSLFCYVAVGLMMSSCADKKFDDAVSILESLPVFIDDTKLNQRVSYEDGTLTVEIPYEFDKQVPGWTGEVIGKDWLPPVFIKGWLGNNIAAFTLGRTLETEKGKSPIKEFLSMMDSKNAKFLIKYDGNSTTLSTDDVRRILADNSQKDDISPYFAKQLATFANKFNTALRGSLHMANAVKEGGTLYLNFNVTKEGDYNDFMWNSVEVYKFIPGYCHLNGLQLAFRYHKVDTGGELESNTVFGDNDTVFRVAPEIVTSTWESFKKEAEKQQK